MPSDLPDIDFARIRPYGQPASRSSAFEELASILIEDGVVEWPDSVRFRRFGNPDGGREGRGVLPNGSVWAWQVKYLFEFDSSAAGQVTSSVRRVLDLEPNLKRYFVVLPFDLPAGDTAHQVSAHTRWTDKVSEWEEAARAKNMEVEFVFVGAHELVTALTEPRHAGRARYWFTANLLTPEWQGRRVEETVAKAGRRYTPRLHVEVETVRALDAVGRVEAYALRWQQMLAELRETRRRPWRAPSEVADAFIDALPTCVTALDEADAVLVTMIAAARSTDEPPAAQGALVAAVEALLRIDDLLREHSLPQGGYFVGDAASLYSDVRNAVTALERAEQLARSATARAAAEKLLLLTGRAGVGKTHLLCDVASRRIPAGLPTVLLLGQDFDTRSLVPQISELSELGGSLEDLLAVLDAASEAAACIGLLMIDALNESERPERWRDDLRALIAAAGRYPHVALVLSCRTEFVMAVIGDEQLPAVEHIGFAEVTEVAVQRFTQDYGLEPPTFPVLNPEFGNPLYLKLTCEALATLGATRFPLGTAGLVTVCNAFVEAVNKRLSEPSRCDYDEQSDPVGRSVRELALLGRGALDRTEVQRITAVALPDRSWSRSLMRGLIAEGLLAELSDGRITFGYQRLGDVTRAAGIALKSQDEIRSWLQELAEDAWPERGVLGALAVIFPEQHGSELIDQAVDQDGTVSYYVVDSFLESLLLRSPESISQRTLEIVRRLLAEDSFVGEIWDRLVRIACVPGHPLNAQWLHTHLAAYEVADRDSSWSEWLVGSMDIDDETAVRRLIEWAWPFDLRDRVSVRDDVAALATQLLGWFLTTTDRRVRDRATKAIVSIAERAPAGFAKALAKFRGTNDPYVIERLTAAACGVVLRIDDADTAQRIADGMSELFQEEWPRHLMTRDFARRVFEVARARGWHGPERPPPYGEQWPVPTRTSQEIEALAGPPDYAYGSIWHSLTGMGDFGRYVLQSALRDVEGADGEALRHAAERAVFDRVLELGWIPERFGEIDRRRSGGRDGVERVGKKYQWIGFYEVLGRIADNHAVSSWRHEAPQLYEYAEQLVWRDIDPTVLVRKLTAPPRRKQLWFSPSQARFPGGTATEYPADMAGVPDPLDLIAVSDPQGAPWLVLVSNPNWQQPLPPEIEALHAPQLDVWMQIHAYLVPLPEAQALSEWAKGKDWFGRWMPDIPEPHNVLLGAHPDDPEWSAADGSIGWWDAKADGAEAAQVLQCAAWYGGTGTSRDASAQEETRGCVPSRRLFDVVGLSRGVDFTWADASGVAVHDPSVVLGGPATIAMRRDLTARLADAGLTIFWTVLIGKELYHSDHTSPEDDYRWVTASASYILNGNQVEQIGAIATRCKPGPTTERELRWMTRKAEV